ncbi:MAG: phytoene synthase, partial [Rhodobacterales bacterium]|nr:phytoene synthase [Rhodobacterales bacterium]
YGWAAAAASYLRAVPELQARGRQPLPEGVDAADLARKGLEKLAAARKARKSVPKDVAPALLAGWQTEAVLRQVLAGRSSPELSEARKRWALLWQAFTGRW